ncbi:hypothetical protein DTO013E5_2309 [Penicillium roqueforti]|uniref:Major facilitator superfamily n=1 Tax=Penicillium roqueforti (strain FM164) TaxID=1365484 RepID=W6QJD3_PENRF|nr:hypothetical protein DTO012A1_2679 [Penicillium roqueforti]CDM34299.1 Major facilitator superfamily [Penicillium roqueforti FM164]KAI2745063.1 hypothetical protein DTO013F2_7517 [Penicillium roqueforti]KAI2770299.1 hypothetical protein DTO012A8_4793 [Penicillium roqueforti]KAI3068890.1 hypothetical protein CBS147339_8020 [Penicillium roqueforti]
MQPAQSDSCATGPRPSPLCEVGHVINGEEDPHTLNPNHSKKPEVDQKIQAVGDELVPLYCVLPNGEKTFVIMAGSFAALFSPLSSSIYLPALPSLASDMNVSVSLINLTITTYLIFQGLAPSFIGSFSDNYGRRPAYIIAFAIYLGANIGLALQDNFTALMILRCMQSSGSSGTIALGSAVVADLSTRAERGKYIGYAGIGLALGPTLGPVIGGLLDHFLGWRSIFWFLVILSAVCLVVILIVLPETCRAVVGNGSVPPASWNRPLWTLFVRTSRFDDNQGTADHSTVHRLKKRPNPITALLIATQKEMGLVLLYGSFLYAGYMAVISTLSTQLASRFGFNSIEIGLCYLPMGIGSISSRWVVGRVMDWNFRREAQLQGMIIHKNRQQDIEKFNVERARLAITLPLIYMASLCILAYGWVMQYRTSLAGPLVMLFFTGLTTTSAFNTLSTLVVDINHQSAATAAAANNLFRCLLGAGATAIASPLIKCIGIGWTGTFIAGLWVLGSPALWVVFYRGYRWRSEHKQDKLTNQTHA